MAKIKVKRVLIDPKFVGDVCRLCDQWMVEIKSHHGEVVSDIIYKHSAAWKDCPIRYAYSGDLGGSAELFFKKESTELDQRASSFFFRNLLVASRVLFELGLCLHFGEDGKHDVYYSEIEVLLDEGDA